MEDIAFTFDPQQFLNGLNLINKNLEQMFTGIQSFADQSSQSFERVTDTTQRVGAESKKSIDEGFGKNASKIVSALTKRFIALHALQKAYNETLKNIPEIGKTFEIAGDIMMRNLFWPLRQLLIPMLQKVLDWTRNHRTMFVRWGTVIANIFRGIVEVVSAIIKVLKSFYQSFISTFENLFGKTTRNLSDFMNIVIFKLTVIFQYLVQLIKPVTDALGKLSATVVYLFSEMFKGLKDGIGNVGGVLGDLLIQLSELLNLITDMGGKGGVLANTFYTLGSVIGMVLAPALRLLAFSFDTIAWTIKNAIFAVKEWNAARDNSAKGNLEFFKLKKEEEKYNQAYEKRSLERGEDQWKEWKESFKKLGNQWSGEEGATAISPAKAKGGSQSTSTVNANTTVNLNLHMSGSDSHDHARKIGETVVPVIKKHITESVQRGLGGISSK